MALTTIETNIILDVYDHDGTRPSMKSIALDDNTRYVFARLTYQGATYDIGSTATVKLVIIRPDKVGAQVAGEAKEIQMGQEDESIVTIYGAYAELDQPAIAVSGTLLGQFIITSGDQILRSQIFSINNGEALDADEWAGQYDGYNLDELVEKVDNAVEKVDGMETDVSDLKSGIGGIGVANIEGDGTTDVTDAILSVLEDSGICTLGEGTYVVDGLVMPNGTTLQGVGDATKLLHKPLVSGSAIKMGSRCTVKNLTLYGDTADITIPTSSEGGTEGTVNYIGEQTVGDGYVKYLLTQALPAGTYHINVTVTSDSDENGVYLRVLPSESYSGANIIMTQPIVKDTPTIVTVDSTSEIRSIWIFAKSSASASKGLTVTVSNISLVTYQSDLIGNRHGIEWSGSEVEFGIIDNCRIEHFSGSAILAMDTGTPIDNNLAVSNCFIRNCIVGIYVRRDSEFAKIANCTIVRNYFGILCRGGNNNISNCGIDGNVVGVQLDADEGHNGGHGVISGCSINHSGGNTGYGLIIKDAGREMVSGCNIMMSKVRVENSNGNVIDGCGFKDTTWEIIGGACSVFSNCMVNTDGISIVVENNTRHKIVNCFTRGGEVVTS